MQMVDPGSRGHRRRRRRRPAKGEEKPVLLGIRN